LTILDDENILRFYEFRSSKGYNNYKYDKTDMDIVKIDITFLELEITENTLSSVQFAKNNLILYPEIKPIIQVLKRYLQIKNMNVSFNGNNYLYRWAFFFQPIPTYPRIH
jgi:hypothetical protein